MTDRAETKWLEPLETEASDISIIGIGGRTFAVGAPKADGTEVVRYDIDGTRTMIWRKESVRTTPDLAWSSGRLLIALDQSGRLVMETIPLAR